MRWVSLADARPGNKNRSELKMERVGLLVTNPLVPTRGGLGGSGVQRRKSVSRLYLCAVESRWRTVALKFRKPQTTTGYNRASQPAKNFTSRRYSRFDLFLIASTTSRTAAVISAGASRFMLWPL